MKTPIDLKNTERCPLAGSGDSTLVDGKTIAVAYPKPGWNC